MQLATWIKILSLRKLKTNKKRKKKEEEEDDDIKKKKGGSGREEEMTTLVILYGVWKLKLLHTDLVDQVNLVYPPISQMVA